VRPRDQPVVAAGDDETRLVDALGDAREAERCGALARLFGIRGARVMLDRLAGQGRQPVPVGGEVVRPAYPGDRAQALLERRGARRVVAAEADARRADALEVDVAPSSRRDGVEDRADRDLVVGPDVELEAGLALAGPVERERRHAALEEDVLPVEELLLRRVEAGD